jgi:hypothetical protein
LTVKIARWYGHFAACYGTIWIALFVHALLAREHVNVGGRVDRADDTP